MIESNANRLVVGSCTPKTHEPVFKSVLESMGIDSSYLEFANIREQNSWVHKGDPIKATKKAIDQIEMAIEEVKLMEPLEIQYSDVIPSTLIIGGGVTGIKAALVIANAGYKVYLVERDLTIGGHMALFDKTFPTLDCSICILGPLMVECKDHPNIELLTYSELKKVEGHVGNFTVRIIFETGGLNIHAHYSILHTSLYRNHLKNTIVQLIYLTMLLYS